MLEIDLLKGWADSNRGSHSIRLGNGHRVPTPNFAVSELVIYPTARPEERKTLSLSFGAGTISEVI